MQWTRGNVVGEINVQGREALIAVRSDELGLPGLLSYTPAEFLGGSDDDH
jgi:hypothetical protein